MVRSPAKKQNGNGANRTFEAQLWAAADKLRGNMEPPDIRRQDKWGSGDGAGQGREDRKAIELCRSQGWVSPRTIPYGARGTNGPRTPVFSP